MSVSSDFPQLGVVTRRCAAPGRDATREARRELRALDGRVDGIRASTIRTQAVPCAYRIFARQIGLDPDADGLQLEQLLLDRLLTGTLPSRGAAADARAIALLDTGVPTWALDAD